MGFFSRVDEILKKINSVVGAPSNIASNLVVGAAKGVMDIPREVAELGGNLGSMAARAINPNAGRTTRNALDIGVERNALTTPSNTTQKIGYGAEKLGEFFIPGMAAGKLAKAAVATDAALLAGKTPLAAAKIASGISTATKVGTEALGAGLVSSVQTGGDIEEARNAAIFSGLATLAAPVATKIASWLNKNIAPRIINSLVKPSNKEFEFGKDAGKAILDEKISAPTVGSFLTKITNKKQEIGKTIGAQLDSVTEMVDVMPAVNKIDDLIAEANTAGERELANKYRDIKDGIIGIFDPKTGTKIGEQDLTSLTAKAAQELKTKIGNAVQWYNTAFEGQTNQARVTVYRAINDIIDTVAPGTKALNMRYANMLTAQTALMRRINNVQRSNLGGLLANLAGGAGTLAGVATNGIGIDDAALGIAAWGLTKFAGSTAGRTMVEAPLVQAAAGAINAATAVRAPLAGLASKIYDSVFGKDSITPTEERKKYEDFINAAQERGISEEEIRMYLQQKKSSSPVQGAF